MDTKIIFTWVELLNSSLIKTKKNKFIGFAGNSSKGYVSCVFKEHAKGYEEILLTFGPFSTLDEACTAVEKYISNQLVTDRYMFPIQL